MQSTRNVQAIADEMNRLIGTAGAVSFQSHHSHLACLYQIILHRVDLHLFDAVIKVANQMQLVAAPDFVMVGFAPAENTSWQWQSPFGINFTPNIRHNPYNTNPIRVG